MQERSSCEANILLASYEIPCVCGSRRFIIACTERKTLVPIFSEINSIDIFLPYVLNNLNEFSIILAFRVGNRAGLNSSSGFRAKLCGPVQCFATRNLLLICSEELLVYRLSSKLKTRTFSSLFHCLLYLEALH
jgi:hypothetical protein